MLRHPAPSFSGNSKGEIKIMVQEKEMLQETEENVSFARRQTAEETAKTIRQQQDQLVKQEILLAEKDMEMAKIRTALAEKSMELTKLKATLADKDVAMVKVKAALSEKDTTLVRARAALSEKDTRIATLIAETEELKRAGL